MAGLPNKRWLMAAAISLIAHVAVLYFAPRLFPADVENKSLAMWREQKPASQPAEKKHVVVQLAESKNKERPDHARHLAEHDQSTKKETRARAKRVASNAGAAPQENVQNVDDLSPVPSPTTPGPWPKKASQPQQKNAHDPLNIRPRFAAGVTPGPSSVDDHIPNVEEGSETNLNAWQWRHAPFFNRVKTRIGNVWSPQVQISRYDPQGALIGQRDRVTVMSVTIDRRGFLKELSVAENSGVAYLDEEAVRAFRAAAPFLYPPQELFGDKEEFSFTFAFHLLVNRGFSFDFQWNE